MEEHDLVQSAREVHSRTIAMLGSDSSGKANSTLSKTDAREKAGETLRSSKFSTLLKQSSTA
jgi:hypothetical protein